MTGDEATAEEARPAATRWIASVTLAGVTGLWLCAKWWVPPLTGLTGTQETYSALEALFTGLAFAGVVWTVLLQGQELKLQRAELASTREEMKRQRDESARTACAQEDAAKLTALVALIRREDEMVGALADQAYDNPADRLDVIDPGADSACREAEERRRALYADLEATYRRIAGLGARSKLHVEEAA
jgi:hypothetical protein